MKIINVVELAKRIGMEEVEVTLPNGTKRKSLNWEKESLNKACDAIRELSGTGEDIVFTGPAPAFLISALTHTVHPCRVAVDVPQIGKDVEIPKLERGNVNKEGGVSFKVTEKDNFVLIEYSLDNPVYDEDMLPNIVVPEVSNAKPVYLSGKGPNYVTVAIAEAYAHTNSSVSLFQPGVGYTCSITHSAKRQLGMLEKELPSAISIPSMNKAIENHKEETKFKEEYK